MSFKNAVLAVAATLLIAPLASHAAVQSHTITVNIEATIPTTNGLQVSADQGWDNQPVHLPYSIATNTLGPLSGRTITVKSPAPIKAHLASAAKLASGTDVIDLAINLGSQNVPVGPSAAVTVATQQEASAGRTLALGITPTMPSGGYKAGHYAGLVNLVFESTIP